MTNYEREGIVFEIACKQFHFLNQQSVSWMSGLTQNNYTLACVSFITVFLASVSIFDLRNTRQTYLTLKE